MVEAKPDREPTLEEPIALAWFARSGAAGAALSLALFAAAATLLVPGAASTLA